MLIICENAEIAVILAEFFRVDHIELTSMPLNFALVEVVGDVGQVDVCRHGELHLDEVVGDQLEL